MQLPALSAVERVTLQNGGEPLPAAAIFFPL
jgi:hypothetical protein